MGSKMNDFLSQIHSIKLKYFQNNDKINLSYFSQRSFFIISFYFSL